MSAATSVTLLPLMVHTAGVIDEKLTVRPDVAVALSVNGGVLNDPLASDPKLIVWLSNELMTVKL